MALAVTSIKMSDRLRGRPHGVKSIPAGELERDAQHRAADHFVAGLIVGSVMVIAQRDR